MSDESFLQEIEDAIKEDQLKKFWDEYGSYILAAAVLAILATALTSGWRHYNEKIAKADTAALITAFDQEEPTAALDEITGDLHSGPRAIAYITGAGMHLRDGRTQEALVTYQNAAKDSNLEPLYRDLAKLLAVQLQASETETLESDPQQMLATLKDLWSDNGNPWAMHARLKAAAIAANELQDYEQATAHLKTILENETVARSLKDRAAALNHVYSLKMKNNSDTAPQGAIQEDPEG